MSQTDDTEGDVLEELASLPTFHHPTASPDGSEVAVYYDVSGRNELHFVDAETGELTQVSDGEVPRNARWWVRWAPSGDRVYFHLDDDGNEQNDVYAIDRDGEVETVVEMDGQVAINDVAEDWILLGSTAEGQMNLYRHDLGGETTKITDYERAAGAGEISPDGNRIAYTTNESDDFENQDVYVASVEPRSTGNRTESGDNADGSDPRNLHVGETGAEASIADWGPEGDRLLVSDNSEDLSRIGVYDLDGDEVTWYGDLEHTEVPVTFLPGGDRILAYRVRRAAVVPIVYDVKTGESRELDLPEGVATFAQNGASALSGDRVLINHTTPDSRPELLAYDLETDEYDALIQAEYGNLDPDGFADADFFTFESDGVPDTPAEAVDHDPYDTLEIEGLLYDSGERPSPLIVNPHGGPRAADFRSFDLYTQFLVSRGYSVLQVNYRGSSGRGREFVEELYDDWGGAEQGDVAVGAEHVLETRDWIDDDRVVVFGGSYGGYSAYWQMVQYPDLYDAGIAWIGLTDLVDQYENTMPHYRTELMEKNLGTPEDAPDLYEERSPITYAENLSAPLLMVHGVNDRRVPVSQARLFRDALQEAGYEEGGATPEESRADGDSEARSASGRASGQSPRAEALGADFEYVELGEEGHASSDIDQKIRMFRTLDDFLDRRIGTAPGATAD